MDTTSVSATIDTTPGTKAYTLAVQYHTELNPRRPADTVPNLVVDLTTLGASPSPSPRPSPPPPPALPEAVSKTVALITAVHEAIRGAHPDASVRKAYGVSGTAPGVEAEGLIARGEKIIARARANPTEALSLGILPSDVLAIAQALADLRAADAFAKGTWDKPTTKERHAAAARMHDAVTRISGAGILAFATNAAVREEFAALRLM